MPLGSGIANKEALDLTIFIQHLIGQITVKRAAVFPVKAGGTNSQTRQFTGGKASIIPLLSLFTTPVHR